MTDLRHQWVQCRACRKRYVCTPEEDYFHLRGQARVFWTAHNGYCWDCFLLATGMPGQPEPAPIAPDPPLL